jgi:hypothetical protein
MSLDQQKQLMIRLEAALLDYVERYGLTEQARTLLTSAPVYYVSQSTISAITSQKTSMTEYDYREGQGQVTARLLSSVNR